MHFILKNKNLHLLYFQISKSKVDSWHLAFLSNWNRMFIVALEFSAHDAKRTVCQSKIDCFDWSFFDSIMVEFELVSTCFLFFCSRTIKSRSAPIVTEYIGAPSIRSFSSSECHEIYEEPDP